MAKFVLLLVGVVLVQTAYSLKCYNCVSKPNNSNCEDLADKKGVEEITCGTNAGNQQVACFKKVMWDNNLKKENVTRACLIVKDKATLCKSPNPQYDVKFCEECTDNLCNGANHVSFGFSSIIGSILSVFVAKLLLW